MKNSMRRRARAGVLGLLLLILLFLFLVRLPFLILSDQDEKTFLYLPLTGEQTFSLYYVHSVHKTPVWENFKPGPGNHLVLTSTVYESLGVGLPFLPGEGKLAIENGRFILSGLDRHFPEVNLEVTPVAGQALVYRDKHYEFNSYFKAGSLIRLRIDRRSPGTVLWQRFVYRGELLD